MKDENGNEMQDEVTTETQVGEVVEGPETETTKKETGASPETEEGKEKEGEEKKPPETKPKTPEDREKSRRFFKERQEKRERERRLELENAELKGKLKAVEEYGLKKGEATPSLTEKDLAEQFARQNPEPKADDFETVADHTKALAKWTVQQERYVENKLVEAKDSEVKQKQTLDDKEKANQGFQERIDTLNANGEEKYEDYEEAVRSVDYPIAVLAAIARTKNGEDVAYYLSQNPEEIDRLEKLEPIDQAVAVGEIKAGLVTGKIQIKKTTTAPPPPKIVAGNANLKVDESKLSDQDWYNRKKKLNSA